MKLRIAGLIIVALVCTASALAQGPCKGYRRGDPNCAMLTSGTNTGASSAGSGGGSAGKETPVPKKLAYDLSVVRIGTGDVLEFTPVQVEYWLTVKEIGTIGTAPEAVPIEICPAVMPPPPDSDTVCAAIEKASPGSKHHGKITVPAPPAGKQSPLRIVALKPAAGAEDYGQRTPVTETAVPLDVAARYEIAITGFDVLTTRSATVDTVWTSLRGLIKSDPPHFSDTEEACNTAGFSSWCVFNQSYGNAGDGSHPVKDVHVGPYDLVPEREKDLRILFFLDNHDHNPAQEIMVAVANGFSKAGMIILGATEPGYAQAAVQLDEEMGKLHSAMAGSCDGEVASGRWIILNTTEANRPEDTLDAYTRGTGSHAATDPRIFRNIDGDLRCDRRGGAYRVSYEVTRTSWRNWGFRPSF